MKHLIRSIIVIAGLLFLASPLARSQSRDLNSEDTLKIRAALEVAGLKFTEEEIKQMARGISSNKRSFKQIRDYSVANSVSPSIVFNPLPAGISPPPSGPPKEWPLEENIELPESKAEIAFMSLPELASLIKNRKISSVELTRIYLDRLKKFNDTLLCVVNLTEGLALKKAAMMDEELLKGHYRGILHGIPYGVKDLMAVKGYPTTWGAMPFKEQLFDENAAVVEKLDEAGAVLVAKLTTGALAMGDIWFGGTTRNPWNAENGSSGSSAGPASATSAGLVAFAIGTETLGSIISPSTRCGVTGLRPSYGVVSKYGTMALSWSMDKIGPICRNAVDCAIVLDFIRGSDSRDLSSIEAGMHYPGKVDLSKLRVGYLKDLFESEYSFRRNDSVALEAFKSLGASLQPVSLPDSIPVSALRVILNAEAAAAFNELTLSDRDSLLVSQSNWSWPNSFRTARLIPAVEYIQANRIRSLLIEEMYTLMKDYDLIICPTFGGNQLSLTNLTGNPSLLLPTGFDDKSNPTSITLIGPLFGEGLLCAVGELYQGISEHHNKRPPLANID